MSDGELVFFSCVAAYFLFGVGAWVLINFTNAFGCKRTKPASPRWYWTVGTVLIIWMWPLFVFDEM